MFEFLNHSYFQFHAFLLEMQQDEPSSLRTAHAEKQLDDWAELLREDGFELSHSRTMTFRMALIRENGYAIDMRRKLAYNVWCTLLGEMEQRNFYGLTIGESNLINAEFPFGRAVATHFEREHKDIVEAARCLALERYTATVFHLTRAIEQLTRRFGKKYLGVYMLNKHGKPTTSRVEHAAWHDILEAINKKIDKEWNPSKHGLPAKKLTPAKKEKLSQYSGLAVQLDHIKNAWRNPVSHGVFYDENPDVRPFEAQNVYDLTRIFAQGLVRILT